MDECTILELSPEGQRLSKEHTEWLSKARSNGLIRRALLDYYADEFERGGHGCVVNIGENTLRLPVLSRRDWVGLSGNLNDFVSSAGSQMRREHDPETLCRLAREQYIRDRNPVDGSVEFPIKEYLWNDDIYYVSGTASDTASFELSRSDFYSYVSHGEGLLREFHDALRQTDEANVDDSTLEMAFDHVPRRDSCAASFDAITTWEEHIHKVGVVCLLVVKLREGEHRAFLIKRSNRVLQYPGTYSVAPGGELKPGGEYGPAPNQTVMRELGEELLGVDEAVPIPSSGGRGKDLNILRGRFLREIKNGKISISRTAFGIDVAAVKPIFSGLVYVSDPMAGAWVIERLDANWEVDVVAEFDLPADDTPAQMHPDLASPPGAFAFYAGLDALQTQFDVDIGVDVSVGLPGQ